MEDLSFSVTLERSTRLILLSVSTRNGPRSQLLAKFFLDLSLSCVLGGGLVENVLHSIPFINFFYSSSYNLPHFYPNAFHYLYKNFFLLFP